jgi:hypothetical protein
VSPGQVALLLVRHRITLRGRRHAICARHILACDAAPGMAPWRGALQALAGALPGLAERGVAATVVLSNHFVRYALVPWSENLADADEELAFARHAFRAVHGQAAGQWELRLGDEAGRAPRLASAIDAELLAGLRGTFDAVGITLESIQPHLMAACNAFAARLPGRGAWLALVEPGRLCLGLVDQGGWQCIRSLRIGSEWRAQLPAILERESLVADGTADIRDVFVWSGGAEDVALPDGVRWKPHVLSPATPGGGDAGASGVALAG